MPVQQRVGCCQNADRLHTSTALDATFNRHVFKACQTEQVVLSEVSVERQQTNVQEIGAVYTVYILGCIYTSQDGNELRLRALRQ